MGTAKTISDSKDGYQLTSPTGETTQPSCGEQFVSFFEDGAKPTWSELQDLEATRRDLLTRTELPIWRILAFTTGTCIRALSKDGLVWLTILIYVIVRITARSGLDQPAIAVDIQDTDLDILGGFLSFLLVLFVNQTNNRFFEMYGMAKRACGQIQDVAGLAVSQLPKGRALRLVRYMNAGQIVGYVGLGGPYTKSNFFDVWNKKHKLLNQKEMTAIEDLNMSEGSAAFKELVTWCQKDVAYARRAGFIDSFEAAKLHTHILNLRASMDGIYDYTDQPTHFFYIHFLCLLSALYLPLFAIDNAYRAGWGENSNWSLEVLNGVIVLLQAIFVVGLRLLGQVMVDPFGDDLEDLSVITYVASAIENSRIILESHQEDDVDLVYEEELARDAVTNSKGSAEGQLA